ncbi:hypothetical protein [Sphingopyxis sp. R3-92]|uniref:hypothetical protein n=1 Tax=Sphingopyxis sp. R3-92 TaxID=3158553 RepID=UPI003EE5FFB5
MARWLKWGAVAIVAAIFGSLSSLFVHVINVSNDRSADMSYADFLSITLTALGLMITVLGIFVAAVGVIGWSTLESKLRSHSLDFFTKQLEKDGELRKEFEQLILGVAYEGVQKVNRDGATSPDEEGKYAD